MTFFCPLASGSKGNAIYLENTKSRILIDIGLNIKQLSERFQKIERKIEDLDAVLITHEHSDHIRGLEGLENRYDVPILASKETARALYQEVGTHLSLTLFTPGQTFECENFKITPFAIYHDTVDPVAFIIESEGWKIGVCTDLGCITPVVEHHLRGCHLLYLEANHDPRMVHASARPNVYKQRVLGRQGHLSNADCAELLCRLWHPDLRHIYLAHLSSECNSPEVALQTVSERLLEKGYLLPPIYIASQDEVSRSVVLQRSPVAP